MATYSVDLHIHTILSPCAEVEMIPPLIISRAAEEGLDVIGITDHNSAENVGAMVKAAEGTSIKVIPGLECESAEGVHLVCLFEAVDDAMDMQKVVYANLPDLQNKPETFGAQFVVDEEGEFIRFNDRLLLAPTEMGIEDIYAEVDRLGGIMIPAHVDRQAYGIYAVLGFLPEQPAFPVLEVSKLITLDEAAKRFPDSSSRTLIRSSDAHRLEEIGKGRCNLNLKTRTLAEIKKALGCCH